MDQTQESEFESEDYDDEDDKKEIRLVSGALNESNHVMPNDRDGRNESLKKPLIEAPQMLDSPMSNNLMKNNSI